MKRNGESGFHVKAGVKVLGKCMAGAGQVKVWGRMWHTGAGRRKGLSFGVPLGLGKMEAQGRFRHGHRDW